LTVFAQLGVTSSGVGTDGSDTHSPNNQGIHVEPYAQWIGTYKSPQLNHITKLEFVDWPATSNQVPEPPGRPAG
jgi:ABC-type Fe3+-citrate transport system substrate-binding protein